MKYVSNLFKNRDKLNGIRNTFTFLANFIVLLSGLILFKTIDDNILQFKILSYIILGTGIVSSLFFIICIDENYLF